MRDDLRSCVLPYGKQVMARGGMWYTPVSGIWQTVWLESLPEHPVLRLDLEADTACAVIDTGDAAQSGTVTVQTPDGPMRCPLVQGRAEVRPVHPRLWSPQDPYLYSFTLETATDRVESYFALRELSIRQVDGHARLCLNGQPFFFHGVLDQGYYSDGLYTPAAPVCYEKDIRAMQALGFNTLRKHIKVEPEEFYYQCDRLGMVVFQDMVNNGDYAYWRDTVWPTVGFQTRRSDARMHRDPAARQAFLQGMEQTVRQLKNHPCIALWTIFNEGWGQFDSTAAYRRLRQLDSSRFIDTTSGWFRGGETDVDSIHHYYGPWRLKAGRRPLLLSEFGGCCLAVEGHLFHPDKAYGYSTCRTPAELQNAILTLYRRRVLPQISKGLCGAIYTQLSDVEDEINGLSPLTAGCKSWTPPPCSSWPPSFSRPSNPDKQTNKNGSCLANEAAAVLSYQSVGQPVQQIQRFLQLGVGLVGVQPLPHTAADVGVHDLLVHPLEQRLGGQQLVGNVHTVPVLLDHPQHAVQLAAGNLDGTGDA